MMPDQIMCDVCRTPVAARGNRWVHTDPLTAALTAGDHDPVRVPQETLDYLRDVIGGDAR